MKAVILAAGIGSRLGVTAKPLLKVGGIEIIARTMKLLSPYVDEFIIVASKFWKEIDEFVQKSGYKYKILVNDKPEKGNGYSLLLTKDLVDDNFVLVMGDHVYSEEFVKSAILGEGIIVDANARYVNLSEATKVKVKNGRVWDVGKDLEEFDGIDTGFFILTKNVFNVKLEKEVISVSDIVREAKIPVTFVNGLFWIDIDTKDDLKRANFLIVKNSVKGVGDGIVSRHFNRKISTRISAFLVNKLTPNQMTAISFLVGIASALVAFIDIRLGGLIYQLSSILDGCDGEIARASLKTSKLGGYIDSMLDRFVDFIFLAVLAITHPITLIPALFAIFGSVMVSYSTEKYRADFHENVYAKIPKMRYLLGKRDERIFIIMIFCLLGLVYEMFVIIALLTNIRVMLTMHIVSKAKRCLANSEKS